MKKLVVFLLSILCSTIYSQVTQIDYKFIVKNTFNDTYEFPAILKVDNTKQKIYTVQGGISHQVDKKKDESETYIIFEKGNPVYILYSQNNQPFIIKDEYKGKSYVLKDDIKPIQYQITKETKQINQKKVKKAIANFRGRNYIIWFDPTSPITQGPWKFNNLPGLAYEIHDEDNGFFWILQNVKTINEKILSPFTSDELKSKMTAYKDYPKNKYKSPTVLYDAITKTTQHKEGDAERNDLETKFEWEN